MFKKIQIIKINLESIIGKVKAIISDLTHVYNYTYSGISTVKIL